MTEQIRQLRIISSQNASLSLHQAMHKHSGSTILLSNSNETNLPHCQLNQARQLLGQEYDCIIYNCFDGLIPDVFAIASGCIRGGGQLILLTPPLDDWPDYDDPSYKSFISHQHQIPQHKRYIAWFVQCLKNDPEVIIEVLMAHHEADNTPTPIPTKTSQPIIDNGIKITVTAAQQTIIDAIIKNLSGHTHRPVIITADRGRGKSTALGLAIKQIQQTHPEKNIIFTSSSINRAYAVLKHVNQNQLQCLAPDVLLKQQPPADLLIIDEAASLPNHILKNLLKSYTRAVLSTTINGYEGLGLGFELKLLPMLKALVPGLKQFHLDKPLRWAENCPLEALTNKLCFLNSPMLLESKETTIETCEITQQQLLAEPKTLQQLMSLLNLAHYKTSPNHLRVLLDAPDLRLFVITCNEQIIGLAEVILEGALPPALAEEVERGQRRVQGHLVAQSLCYYHQNLDCVTLSSARIHRIVIHPQHQRQGLGSELLRFIRQQINVDYFSSSFGASANLINFWQANGYFVVRIGLKPETSTGEHSVIVLSAANDQGYLLQCDLPESHLRQLNAWLPAALQEVDAQVVAAIYQQLSAHIKTSSHHQVIIKRFANMEVDYEIALPFLIELVPYWLAQSQIKDQELICALVKIILQKQPWCSLHAFAATSGKKDGVKWLQQKLQQEELAHDY